MAKATKTRTTKSGSSNELIERLVAKTGIERPVAQKAVGIILAFLVNEGPAEKVQDLIAQMPGADALLQSAQGESYGFFGSMSGIMGAGSRLMGTGLSMGQVQSVAEEMLAYTREKVGEDKVGKIMRAIPGLGQFA